MFKQIEITLPGFRLETLYVKELSIRQVNQVLKKKTDSDIDMLLNALSFALVDEEGQNIINKKYSIDDFADELPQSYLNILADAYAELNVNDDDKQLDTAKKS